MRIVSLVPSQTELLYYLGIEPIAQTIFCVHPAEKFKSAIKIGGTKKLNIQKIISLKPDLVIGNKEENEKLQIESLAEKLNVWLSDIYSVADALQMIKQLGEFTHTELKAENLIGDIKSSLSKIPKPLNTPKVLYLIWKDPYMAAGRKCFINSMLQTCGFENVLTEPDSRYPEIDEQFIANCGADIIMLSSEPYPFKPDHCTELRKITDGANVELVDGEMFSWYGNRMLKASAYFTKNIPAWTR